MQDNNTARKKVYDVLRDKTGYSDSYEDFNKFMDENEEARKKVYDVLKDKTGYSDSYEDFNQFMQPVDSSVQIQQPNNTPQTPKSDYFQTGNGYDPVSRTYSGGVGTQAEADRIFDMRNYNPSTRPGLREQVHSKDNFQFITPSTSQMESDKTEVSARYQFSPINLGERLKVDMDKGKLDKLFTVKEESHLDKEYTPRAISSMNDVYNNYRDRFALTERGRQLSEEMAGIQKEIQDKYANRFLASDEYRKLSQQYKGNELNQKANEAFQKAYGEVISKELEPYQDIYNKEITSRYGTDMKRDLAGFAKKSVGSHLNTLTNEVNKDLDDIEEKITEQKKILRDDSGNAMVNARMNTREDPTLAQYRGERTYLEGAKNLIDESNNIIEEAGKKGKTNFFSGLARGFADTAFDPKQWTLGISDMIGGIRLKNVVEKADKGEKLSPSEEKLLDAAVTNMAVNAYYSSDLGRGYKAGQTTGASIPFMLEFAINPISAAGEGIAKSILKYGMKKFGASAMKKGMSKMGARLAGDALAAAGMEGSTGLARVAAGAQDRMIGNILFDVDKDGNLTYKGREGGMDMGKAIGKSIVSTFLENQSEMIFNAFKGLGKGIWKNVEETVPGGASEFMKYITNSRAGKLYREIKDNPTFKEAAKKAQFHGLPEEYMEEVYNNLANVPLGEMTLEEATDLDNNIDTFLGLAPTSVAFGLLGLGSMGAERVRHRQKMNAAFGNMTKEQQEKLSELERMSKERGNDDIRIFIKETMNDGSLSKEEKKAEIEYAFDIAKNNAMEDIAGEQTREESEKRTAAQEEGTDIYTTHDPVAMRTTVLREEVSRERLSSVLDDEAIDALAGANDAQRAEMLDVMDEETKRLATDYLRQKDRHDAVEDALDEAHASEYEQAAVKVQQMSPQGQVVTIPLGRFGDKEHSYGVVVNGLGPNGEMTISGGTLMIVPLENGKTGPVYSSFNMDNATAIKPDANMSFSYNDRNEILTQMLESYQIDAEIMEQQPTSIGQSFNIMDNNGNLATASVIGQDQSGNWIIAMEGMKEPITVNDEQLRLMKDNADKASIRQEYADIDKNIESERLASKFSPEVLSLVPQGGEEVIINGMRGTIDSDVNDVNGIMVTWVDDNDREVGRSPITKDDYYTYKQSLYDTQKLNDSRKDIGNAQEEREEKSLSEYDNYVNTGNVSDETVERITNKIKNGDPLSPKEESMKQGSASRVEQILANMKKSESLIPVDKKGNPVYHKAPVEATIADLNDGTLEPEEVDEFISLNRKEAVDQLAKLEDKAPKMRTNKAKYVQAKKDWQVLKDEQRQRIDYWDEVKRQIKSLREKPGDAIAEEILSMEEPMNGEELAAQQLANGNIRLLQSSFSYETGFGKDEVKKFFGLFASADKGGVTIQEAGEYLMQTDRENGTGFFDQNDPNAGRDAIINVLAQVNTKGELANYIKESRKTIAERERTAEEEAVLQAMENASWEEYGMSYEDLQKLQDAITASMEQMPHLVEEFKKSDEYIEFINTFVETKGTIDNGKERNDRTGLSESKDEITDDEPQRDNRPSPGSKEGYDRDREKVSETQSGERSRRTKGSVEGNQQLSDETGNGETESRTEEIKGNSNNTIQDHIAEAREMVDTSPTEAQKEAGNYKKGHIKLDGYDITIENPKGSVRSGKDANGQEWSITMNNDYGYIRGTKAVDGDHIDIFLSDNPSEGNVFVVDQLNEKGEFDESKVMYGFPSMDEARSSYLANYSPGWENRISAITEVTKDEFYKWIDSSVKKTKPFSEYKSVNPVQLAPSIESANADRMKDIETRLAEIEDRKIELEDILVEAENDSVERDAVFSEQQELNQEQQELETEYSGLRAMNDESNEILASEGSDIRFREVGNEEISSFANKHNLDEADVKKYAQSMKMKNLGGASYAFKSISRNVRLQNSNLSLGQFVKVFSPIKKELYEKFGDVDALRDEYVQEEMKARNMMEAARKRAEEEAESEKKRLKEFELMTDEEMDEAYFKAMEENNEARMRDIINESARRNGYVSADEFRMAHRAPSYDEEGIDKNMVDIAANKDQIRESLNEQLRMNRDQYRNESAAAINEALSAIDKGEKPTVTIYRAVPKSLKEGKVRNGDWVSLSESYVKVHGKHVLNGNYRIMKEEVPAENLYWDGNDINEWGYDDRSDYRYKNTKNNRKLNDLITRDDKGNVIPPSKRFNARKADVRYRFIGEKGASQLDKAEEATTRLDNLNVAREMESAFNTKKGRIEKLRKSEPVEITGKEVTPSDDLKQYKKNALEYGKNLQGEYTNKDTGRTIQLQRRRKNGGLKEILQHDTLNDTVQIKSVAAIPSIIENAIYIDSSENQDVQKNPNVVAYHYYICGLKIGSEDYTVRMVEAEEKDGNRYYDHKLTHIEKGKLINELALINPSSSTELSSTPDAGTEDRNRPTNRGEIQTAPISNIKDKKLVSLLQTNEKENARKIKQATGWERGADGKWRYEVEDFEIDPKGLARRNRLWSNLSWGKEYDALSDKLFDGVELTEEEAARFDELSEKAEELRATYEANDVRYLDDYVKDENLFKAYPELKQIRVEIYNAPTSNTGATYYGNQNLIRVNESVLDRADFRSILAHEVQHAVQSIEGFARGGNSMTYRKHLDALKEKRDAWSMIEEFADKREELGEDASQMDVYNALVNEYHSDGFEFGDGFIPSRNAFDKGFNLWVRGYDKEGYEDAYNEYQSLIEKFGLGGENDRYNELSGEVEARNVQSRMNMTPEERRNTLASETEDVAREDQIFINDALEAYASVSAPMNTAVNELSESLHTPIEKITSEDQLPQGEARRRIESGANIKGWYSPKENKVYLYMPNTASVEDAQATIFHEVVAHKGLRELFGKDFDTFLDNVYNNAAPSIRQAINRMAENENISIRTATEEYMADLSERGPATFAEQSLWTRIKAFFIDMLRKAKVNLGFELTDNELRYILYESYNRLKQSNYPVDVAKETVMRSKLGIGELDMNRKGTFTSNIGSEEKPSKSIGNTPRLDKGILFRKEPGLNEEYNDIIKSGSFGFQEAFQDSMLSLKVVMDLIEKQTGNKARTYENAYTAENRLSSINKVDNENYMKDFFEPLMKEVKKLSDLYGRERLEEYLLAKSGLERNEVFKKRDADKAYDEAMEELDKKLKEKNITQKQYDTLKDKAEEDHKNALKADKDYSGLEGLVFKPHKEELDKKLDNGDITEKEYEEEEKKIKKGFKKYAENLVFSLESETGKNAIETLWKKINAATGETLRKEYESGLMSREIYNEVKGMMRYYVPLRGWEETTAEQVFDYNRKDSPIQNNQKKTKGRKSIADNPIATIAAMAQSAIVRGNRNRMKQRFFNFIVNRPNTLATFTDTWFSRQPDGSVEEIMPDIKNDDSPEVIAQKLDDFEKKMKEAEKRGDQVWRGRLPFGVELKMKPGQKKEHIVPVMINGKEYNIYINGDPRAAQALNGLTSAESDANWLAEFYKSVKRFYAGGLTSNNPDFAVANFVRDSIHAANMIYLDKGILAAGRFILNTPKSFNAVFRGITGKAGNTKEDTYFKEFLKYGGETGYTAIHTLEDYKKEYDKELEELKGLKKMLRPGMETVSMLADWFQTANRIVEDVNRFNAYMSARKSGMSIEESVDAAKNITVNFNKKGALGKGKNKFWAGIASILGHWVLFFNPSIQGQYQLWQKRKEHQKKFYSLLATIMTSGMMIPMLNEILVSADGGDDKDDYWKQNDYARRNNLMLYIGDGYVKIPLPPFFREIYGMGDILYSLLNSRITPERAGLSTLAQIQSAIGFINLISESERESGPEDLLKGIAPDLLAPIMDIAFNKDFTGRPIAKRTEYNKFIPEYQRVYKGVNPGFIAISEALNDMSGGDEVKRGWLNNAWINPAYMQHLFTSYLGGIGKNIANASAIAVDAATGNEENIDLIRQLPIVPRFFSGTDERIVSSAINRDFREYENRYNRMNSERNRYKEFVKKGRTEYRDELERLKSNGEEDFIKYFKKELKKLRRKQEKLKNNPDDKALEKEITDLKAKITMESRKLLMK
mgnify:CR=1 FL=1|jgi:hypothetical protein